MSRAQTLHTLIGTQLADAEEGTLWCPSLPAPEFLTIILETFLLFSQQIPSNNLGFVDATAENIELEIAGRHFSFQQSPGLLHSNNAGGTTGAVLWKVTPLLARWLASHPLLLSELDCLGPKRTIVELGCGLTGLIGQVLSRHVQRYILTDQASIIKHLKTNLLQESVSEPTVATKHKKKDRSHHQNAKAEHVLRVMAFDWEKDAAENLRVDLTPEGNIDLVIICDCVYNDYLVNPLVQTCVDICRIGARDAEPTVVLIAQQLRSDSIFELFLQTLMREFEVWRVPDELLSTDMGSGSGYAVHMAVLKV